MTDQTAIVPLIRRDGWTAARKAQFLDHLAIDGSVAAAAVHVGMRREEAYRLRRRDPDFARAWNAALVLAREAAAEVLENRAIHGVEEQIWFRGELVGTRRKYDSRLLLAHIGRLDRIADDEQAGEDAARFDELLAVVAGEAVDETIAVDGESLPLTRDEAIACAAQRAEDDWDHIPEERIDEDVWDARERAMAEAEVCWDEWFARATETVDRLLSTPLGPVALDGVTSVTGVSTSPAHASVN